MKKIKNIQQIKTAAVEKLAVLRAHIKVNYLTKQAKKLQRQLAVQSFVDTLKIRISNFWRNVEKESFENKKILIFSVMIDIALSIFAIVQMVELGIFIAIAYAIFVYAIIHKILSGNKEAKTHFDDVANKSVAILTKALKSVLGRYVIICALFFGYCFVFTLIAKADMAAILEIGGNIIKIFG